MGNLMRAIKAMHPPATREWVSRKAKEDLGQEGDEDYKPAWAAILYNTQVQFKSKRGSRQPRAKAKAQATAPESSQEELDMLPEVPAELDTDEEVAFLLKQAERLLTTTPTPEAPATETQGGDGSQRATQTPAGRVTQSPERGRQGPVRVQAKRLLRLRKPAGSQDEDAALKAASEESRAEAERQAQEEEDLLTALEASLEIPSNGGEGGEPSGPAGS